MINSSYQLSSSDDWIIPTRQDIDDLRQYLGGDIAADACKTLTSWNEPHTNHTNSSGLSIYSRAYVNQNGDFTTPGSDAFFYTGDVPPDTVYGFTFYFRYNYSKIYDGTLIYASYMRSGRQLRLMRKNVGGVDGTKGIYIGNNGYIYDTIIIDGNEWLTSNLCESKNRDLSDLPKITSNTDWKNTTTPAYCHQQFNDLLF